MIRCNNCGTNNIDGSEYCDECGMKLDLVRRQNAYKPPSAVESDAVPSNTTDGPPIAPPSFTTSTSIPKPAMPARERKPDEKSADGNSNKRRNVTDERSAFNISPAEPNRPNQGAMLRHQPSRFRRVGEPMRWSRITRLLRLITRALLRAC